MLCSFLQPFTAKQSSTSTECQESKRGIRFTLLNTKVLLIREGYKRKPGLQSTDRIKLVKKSYITTKEATLHSKKHQRKEPTHPLLSQRICKVFANLPTYLNSASLISKCQHAQKTYPKQSLHCYEALLYLQAQVFPYSSINIKFQHAFPRRTSKNILHLGWPTIRIASQLCRTPSTFKLWNHSSRMPIWQSSKPLYARSLQPMLMHL